MPRRQWLQCPEVYFHRERLAKQFDRNHDAVVVLDTHENSFDSGKGSTDDAHAVAGVQESVRLDRFVQDQLLQRSDFFVRNRTSPSVAFDEAKNPRSLQDIQLLISNRSYEEVARKKRENERLHPVIPSADIPVGGQESLHSLFCEEICGTFFVLVLGISSKPQNRSELLSPLGTHRIPLHKASPSDSQQSMREPQCPQTRPFDLYR